MDWPNTKIAASVTYSSPHGDAGRLVRASVVELVMERTLRELQCELMQLTGALQNLSASLA
jgi:hypothetical protein